MSSSASGQRLLLKVLLGLAITAGLFLFLFRYVDLSQLTALFARTHWSLWLCGLGVWTLLYLGRAVRFIMLAPRTPYSTMLCITAVHNMLLRILPFRSGELAYAFLLKRAGTAKLGESLLSLLLLRILDSTAVVMLFATALAFHHGTYLGDRRLGLLVALAAAFIGGGLALALVPLLRLVLRLARRATNVVGLGGRPRVQRILDRVAAAVDDFGRVKRSVVLWTLAISLVLWLLTFAAFFAIMRAFFMPVGVAQTVLGSTAAVVTGFLPIGGIGSFGTLEAGWALGFVLVGLDRTRAVLSGFGVSLTTFTYGLILGLLGWIGLILGSRGASDNRGRTDS